MKEQVHVLVEGIHVCQCSVEYYSFTEGETASEVSKVLF
jgi:hypothetical protein